MSWLFDLAYVALLVAVSPPPRNREEEPVDPGQATCTIT